jgi:hypothetical protein
MNLPVTRSTDRFREFCCKAERSSASSADSSMSGLCSFCESGGFRESVHVDLTILATLTDAAIRADIRG